MIMLTICDRTVGVIDGLYCLNDLHKASGGAVKHQPSFFLRNKETKELIMEIDRSANMMNGDSVKAVRKIRGGDNTMRQGTYVCRDLVIRYAMWINPKFYLMVIRTFDEVANKQQELSKRLDVLCKNLDTVTTNLSKAGRFLNVGGKQIKPQLEQLIGNTLKEMQPSLNLVGGTDNHDLIQQHSTVSRVQ